MKISNFVLKETFGKSPLDWRFHASVDVETGFLWWKKKQTRPIGREYCGHWMFLDTGGYTPGFQVEDLAKAHRIKTGEQC